MKKIIFLIYININSMIIYSQSTIIVDAGQLISPNPKFMQGFLHGGSAYLDSVKVAKLKPAYWRIGAYFLAGSGYTATKRFNPKITVNINDLYMIAYNIPSQNLSQPWVGGWSNWDNLVTMIANNSLANNEPVDEWDVWGEPDNFWTGTYNQWIEMYRRTDSIITSIIPNAKIIGPEFGFGACNFNVNPIIQFLDNLYSIGTTISGVSWHEFCNPEQVPIHVQQVRDSLAVRPWLGNLDILIPEYAGPANHTIPGWNVGWLYYFEKSNVDWVSHGCWNETDGTNSWSNCEFGLNGLFMSDNQTPQPNYWVHRSYAELDSTRLFCNSTHIKTIGIASKNNLKQEIKILLGRYDNPNLGSHNALENVEIKIKNFPYCSNCSKPIVIQRIPSNNVAYAIPLNSPVTTFTGIVTFIGDSASINVNNFVDGDAYNIYINPSSGSVLTTNSDLFTDNELSIYPNPVNDDLNIKSKKIINITLKISNILGETVREFYLDDFTTTINISDLKKGIYIIQDTQQKNVFVKFCKE